MLGISLFLRENNEEAPVESLEEALVGKRPEL